MRDRELALGLGLAAALLLFLGFLVDLVFAAADLLRGHLPTGVGFPVIELVVAVLTAGFSLYGAARGSDNALPAGVLLVVLGILDWGLLGFDRGFFSLLAVALTVLAGVLFMLAGGRRRVPR